MHTVTRALLLTDVVDSTKLSEALGDVRMAELWARHDRLARDLLPAHRGLEIDKTDGFLLLFEHAADAVAYAVAYHRALRSLELAARAGLHVGEVILTENLPVDVARGAKPLEVDGVAKPTAARVMSVASGGQTLLTPAAVDALGATPLRLESHGHWRMKGVAEPIELFEVGDDEAPFVPPADAAKVYRVVERDGLWLPVREIPHSLPAERDVFVGRQADLRSLARAVDQHRLVSVLGIGGTGKTRLVTRFGWSWLGDHPGGVWFCDLSEARSVEGILAAVARALDVPLGGGDPVARLGHVIAGRGPCLVVLDNFEQVARFAPQTLEPWLDRAPEARFVVTTREVLGLPGEAAVPLAPLQADDSVDLFVARARQGWPGFVLDDPGAVRDLIQLLDRLPLAIELAAARVRVMPPRTLLARMSERFKLLSSRGARHTRHATLRGALDWSWDLLAPDERAALAQLSVFEGGFTLEAAEGVLALDELWPMDAVQALVDKSLVRQVGAERSDATRFDLLVSVQEYAAEQLGALGARDAAEARHAAFFARRGENEAVFALDRPGGVALRRALFLELDNLVAGCRRCIAGGDAANAALLLRAVWQVIKMQGPYTTTLDLAERVLGMAEVPPAGRIAAHRILGETLLSLGRPDRAEENYEAGLALARAHGDRFAEATALGDLALVCGERSRLDEKRALLEASLALYLEIGGREGAPLVQGNLGSVLREQGRYAEALACFEAALAADRANGNRRSEANTLGSLANLCREQGRFDDALRYCERAVAIHREVGNVRQEAATLTNLANLHAETGRLDEALGLFQAAIALHRRIGSRSDEGVALANLGVLHRNEGRPVEARASFESALEIVHETGDLRFEGWVLSQLAGLDVEAGAPDAAARRLDEAEPLIRETKDPVMLCVLLSERVGLFHRLGDAAGAWAALAEAEATAPEGHPVRGTLEKARAVLEGR